VRLANANSGTTKNVVGLVYDTTINAAASGSIVVTGQMTATTGQWDAVSGQTGGLTSGSIYYLSNATAGNITTTAPSTGYIAPIGIALSTTKMLLNIGPTIKL
jgi:predicted ribonuclease toxin of YeeF-YezG toxin-antitoxin module